MLNILVQDANKMGLQKQCHEEETSSPLGPLGRGVLNYCQWLTSLTRQKSINSACYTVVPSRQNLLGFPNSSYYAAQKEGVHIFWEWWAGKRYFDTMVRGTAALTSSGRSVDMVRLRTKIHGFGGGGAELSWTDLGDNTESVRRARLRAPPKYEICVPPSGLRPLAHYLKWIQ
jgi:hypothetical protein